MGTVTRQGYEGECLRVLREGLGLDEAEARRRLEREYPKATSAAIQKLRFRGLDCSEWKAMDYCERRPELSPPIVGDSRVWGKQHIDDFAEVLKSHGKLLPSAIYRAELGISWAQEQEIHHWLETERKEAVHAE
jgi:hypothetical protein